LTSHCIDIAQKLASLAAVFIVAAFSHQILIFTFRPGSSAPRPDFGFNSLKG
jgi:hypothetical protein